MLVTAAGSEITVWTLGRSTGLTLLGILNSRAQLPSDIWTSMHTKIYEDRVQHIVHLDNDRIVLITGNQHLR
jgi:hypothetical protein